MVKVELTFDELIEVGLTNDQVIKGYFKGMFGDKPVILPVDSEVLLIVGEYYWIKVNA